MFKVCQTTYPRDHKWFEFSTFELAVDFVMDKLSASGSYWKHKDFHQYQDSSGVCYGILNSDKEII